MTKGIGKRLAPWRFIAFLALLAAGSVGGIALFGWRQGFLTGFDVAAFVFLASLAPLMHGASADEMRRHARDNDANRTLLLAITGAVSLAVLGAIAAELSQKGGPGPAQVALVVATLALSWLFSNAVYTLHYAHVFYLKQDDADGGDCAGLDFPDCDEPDYWDFAYFAFTLGMTFQTSDVGITARSLRKTALFHCLAAFVFNIGVLAFSINVLGGS